MCKRFCVFTSLFQAYIMAVHSGAHRILKAKLTPTKELNVKGQGTKQLIFPRRSSETLAHQYLSKLYYYVFGEILLD